MSELKASSERPIDGLSLTEEERARQGIVEWLERDFGPDTEVVLADGFEAAFIGVGRQFSNPPFAVYDADKCLDVLVQRDGMTEDEAGEFFEYNVAGAWVGPQTPVFLHMRKKEGA